MSEDLFSGEKSVVRTEPSAAEYETEATIFRSLAGLGVVYGLAGVMLVPFGLLRFHQGDITGDFKVNLFQGPLQSTSFQALWLLISSLTGGALGAALLIGSIGAVTLKRWSLTVLRLWAVASILFGAVGSIFYFSWLLPPWREQWAQVRGVDDSLFNLGGWMIGSLLAIAMLVVINRPAVRNALQRGGAILRNPPIDSD